MFFGGVGGAVPAAVGGVRSDRARAAAATASQRSIRGHQRGVSVSHQRGSCGLARTRLYFTGCGLARSGGNPRIVAHIALSR
eukprot:206069-Pyramimonas_sp.AAC.1